MDWFLPAEHAHASEMRRELRRHLERHARSGADLDAAEIAFSEVLTNAVEHGGSKIWVSLNWGSKWPVVTIHDLGPGFDFDEVSAPNSEQTTGRGLIIATTLSRSLRARVKVGGGTVTSLVLDIERDTAADIDPDPSPARFGLPRLDEAGPDGYFGREAFLKSLAVEVANHVESEHGPALAEQTIATVGATVGRQMETSYRNHRGIDGQLTTRQIAELYVGLKSSIGGSFSVVDVDDDRIVLENSACPFGEAVMEAPSLCRMTSSVFGGIAARNGRSDVAVDLEERIAVGDPHCRVTVWLSPPPSEIEVFVHRYGRQADDDSRSGASDAASAID